MTNNIDIAPIGLLTGKVWVERFRARLADALGHGAPSLASVAHQLAVSPRTLQRRLAEHGTTWREELDCARRQRARLARLSGVPSIAHLTSQLGYEDSRSARRALRRWASASLSV